MNILKKLIFAVITIFVGILFLALLNHRYEVDTWISSYVSQTNIVLNEHKENTEEKLNQILEKLNQIEQKLKQ